MGNEITYIIGNGLDLSLGLKTSYRDFYKHIKKTKTNSKNKIYEAIENDPESWSYFELVLGAYTRYIEKLPETVRSAEASAFHEDLEELINDLADYLETQDKLVQEDISLTKECFFEELPAGQKNKFTAFVSNRAVNFSFVTLNYTRTLEKILPKQNVRVMPSGIMVRDIHHIHGDLYENMTLGVSNESQLSTALEGDDKNFLIKPDSIRSTNDGRLDELKRLLDRSSIVVLFGTSIGESDGYLWVNLIDWLSESDNRSIIIHQYDKNYKDGVRRIPRRRAIFVTEVQDKLLNNIQMDEDIKMELRNRIYVVHNTEKLFALKK